MFSPSRELTGYTSWYGPQFHGKKTANGEVYNMNEFTAAHRTAAFGTRFEVTNTQTGQSTTVRINDRGPFVKGRIIDLSFAAAKAIGLVASGTALVELRALNRETPSAAGDQFFVQIGSFKDAANARNLADKLRSHYVNLPVQVIEADGLSKVWAGPYASEEVAQKTENSLTNDGFESLVLRR